jgi:hypothetical protein
MVFIMIYSDKIECHLPRLVNSSVRRLSLLRKHMEREGRRQIGLGHSGTLRYDL